MNESEQGQDRSRMVRDRSRADREGVQGGKEEETGKLVKRGRDTHTSLFSAPLSFDLVVTS